MIAKNIKSPSSAGSKAFQSCMDSDEETGPRFGTCGNADMLLQNDDPEDVDKVEIMPLDNVTESFEVHNGTTDDSGILEQSTGITKVFEIALKV